MTFAASFGAQANAVLSALKTEGVDLSNVQGVPGQLWGRLTDAAANDISAAELSKIADVPAIEAHGMALTWRHKETGQLDTAGLGYMAMYLFCAVTGHNLKMAAMPIAHIRAQKGGAELSGEAIDLVHDELRAQAEVAA